MTTENTSTTALELRPVCPASESHGFMSLRTHAQTKEQQWCGVWYDCNQCTSSTLYPSPELKAQNDEGYARILSAYKSLRRDSQRKKFLKGYAPWIVSALEQGRESMWQ